MTVCDADAGVQSMDGERITLRLEAEDLDLIEKFVERRPEFSNRSHLARVAIRAFIQGAQGSSAPEEKGNRVAIDVPRAILREIEELVRNGYYTSVGGAIEEAVRKEFLTTSHMEEVKKKILETRRDTLELLP
jgi:Arc/MetJ-type ribon-helix-helix transcriptional regulator